MSRALGFDALGFGGAGCDPPLSLSHTHTVPPRGSPHTVDSTLVRRGRRGEVHRLAPTTRSSMISLFRLFSWSLLLTAVSGRSLSEASPFPLSLRQLEDAAVDVSSSSYQLQTGVCFRVKIAENNDDDGNSFFYNGAYRAQYLAYMSYRLCEASGSNGSNCQTYVTDLGTFLSSTVTHLQTLCQACQQTCRRSLRSLEEEQPQQQEVSVDCSSCSSVCQSLQNANGLDETQYMNCQQSEEQSEDGLVYYTAPQCDDGTVVIGRYYDNECTIKASKGLGDFGYATFGAIQSTPLDCSLGNTCQTLVANAASSCSSETNNNNINEAAKLCRAAANASRVKAYHKKPFYKKIPLTMIAFCAVLLVSSFLFLSYTYYIRHQHAAVTNRKTPLSELDGEAVDAPLPALT